MASAHAERVAAIYAAQQLEAARSANQDLLNQNYGQAYTDVHDEGDAAKNALAEGLNNAYGVLTPNYDSARQQYTQAAQFYTPYATTGQQALGSLADASGINGLAGNANARLNFQASPGYQWDQEQAADTTARKAAALGVAGSGNTLSAINSQANHLADSEYNNYVSRLQGLSQQGLQAAGQMANLTKGIGDLDVQEGTQKANLWNNWGTTSAGVDTGLGTTLANISMNKGNQLAANNMQAATGSSNAVTSAAQASDAANNANQNLLLGVLGLGLKGVGAFTGSGGLLKALGS